MRPPECAVCGHRFDPAHGELIAFCRDDEADAWYARTHQDEIVGHPPNVEWFCERHAPLARELRDWSLGEALQRLSRLPTDPLDATAVDTGRVGAPSETPAAALSRAGPDGLSDTSALDAHDEWLILAETLAERLGDAAHDWLHEARRQGRLETIVSGRYLCAEALPERLRSRPEMLALVLACRLAQDAAIAFHSALVVHGLLPGIGRRVTFVSSTRFSLFAFRGIDFLGVRPRRELRRSTALTGTLRMVERDGLALRVTSLERSVVDALDSVELCGGLETVRLALSGLVELDVDAAVDYAQRLRPAHAAARLGYLLEQGKLPVQASTAQLQLLRAVTPAIPVLLDPSCPVGRRVSSWNLVVPDPRLDRPWA
ncbi:MAG: hypothetical protein KDK91_21535 [Gammaproteobacteria bacterium]|nr:hypothetical protein [Gammaproteobacteria bacterium]